MPLDIIRQEIYTGSINIGAHSCDSPLDFSVCPYLATPYLSLHWIGCKHIPSYFAFPIVVDWYSHFYSQVFNTLVNISTFKQRQLQQLHITGKWTIRTLRKTDTEIVKLLNECKINYKKKIPAFKLTHKCFGKLSVKAWNYLFNITFKN